MDQGVILTFTSYYIRIHFKKLYIVAINSDFSNGTGQSKLKTRKGVTILDAILNICVSWEEVKISINRSLEEVTSNSGWLWWMIQDFDGGSNHWYNRSSKKTRTKDVTKLLPSYHKRTDKKLLPMDEQRKWFLHIESTPGEDATKIVEITGFRIVHKLKW